MSNFLPPERIRMIDENGKPSREYYDFLRGLLESQAPIGSIILSLSPTPPKGFLPFGTTYSKDRYPKLYAVLQTETLPNATNGLYFAHNPAQIGKTFGANSVSLAHEHTKQNVASGAGASVDVSGQISPLEVNIRPYTLGVTAYIRAE